MSIPSRGCVWSTVVWPVLACLSIAASAPTSGPVEPSLELSAETSQAACHATLEFWITGVPDSEDPFDPAKGELSLVVTEPSGEVVRVPAFFTQDYERRQVRGRDWFYPSGEPGWRARFTPRVNGRYSAAAVWQQAGEQRESSAVTFQSMPSSRRGFVRVSQTDPRFFEFSTGEPFFPIGQNLAFVGGGQYVTLSKAENILRKLGDNGANYIRLWTCCEDWALAVEARKSAWGRSWDWRPPFGPDPDEPGRSSVVLTNERATAEANPSHPVALQPGTRYLLSGRVRTDPDTSVAVTCGGRAVPRLTPAPGKWTDWRNEFQAGESEYWLGTLRFERHGPGKVWLKSLSLREADGGPELLWETAINRPVRGFYNPLDCFLLDEIVRAAEANGVYLQVCLLTRDLYMSALKDPTSDAYTRAIADAKKTLRYAVARWGASTQVAGWEYWNEMDPGLPTERFHQELGAFLAKTDPWEHLRQTSTWGPAADDCRHPALDVADTHFYLRHTDASRLATEVEAVLERAAWLRKQAPAKPALLGEFGLADDRWRLRPEMNRRRGLADVHNALWASALSGLSGTALSWWWERLDAQDVYPLYRPLSRFLADVPWTRGEVSAVSDATVSVPGLRVLGLQAGTDAWLWVFDPAGAWEHRVLEGNEPPSQGQVRVTLGSRREGRWQAEWIDTRSGEALAVETVVAGPGGVGLAVPSFRGDVACRLHRVRE